MTFITFEKDWKNAKFQEIKSAKHQKAIWQTEEKKSIFVFFKRPKWELEEEDSDIYLKRKKREVEFLVLAENIELENLKKDFF